MPDGSVMPKTKEIRDLPPKMADRLIVALDAPTIEGAFSLVEQLSDDISFFKIGFRLQFERGFDNLIDHLQALGKKIFLDAKIYDIPETVAQAVASAARRNVNFITVHGDEMIMKAAVESKGSSGLKIFAVTVLTSLDDAALKELGYAVSARVLVNKRARMAVDCGCDGVIASANDDPNGIRELAAMPSLLIATPGIRLSNSNTQDQKRTANPTEAIQNGADYLVVGRPIIESPNPSSAAKTFIAEMEAARV